MQIASFLFRKMHHIFINENEIDLSNKTIIVDGNSENYNHLVKSLRVELGEMVLCSVVPFLDSFDYKAEVVDIGSTAIKMSVVERTTANELAIDINLYQGISKSDKLEFIIEKAVELGVKSITPIATEYCVAKIEDKKVDKKTERYNKISKSAAEQSKRHIVPKVYEPIDYKTLIKNIVSKKSDDKGNAIEVNNFLFYENASGITYTKEKIAKIVKNLANKKSNKIEVNVIIGPEGGFSEKEIVLAKENGVDILSLGDRILRTETAAVTALSILMYELS